MKPNSRESQLYGLINKITAHPGRRAELVAILTGSGSMPGCRSYIVALDPSDHDAIYVTEVWTDQAAHRASLTLPAVKEAIGRGRALIAGFQAVAETEPVGGIGL